MEREASRSGCAHCTRSLWDRLQSGESTIGNLARCAAENAAATSSNACFATEACSSLAVLLQVEREPNERIDSTTREFQMPPSAEIGAGRFAQATAGNV